MNTKLVVRSFSQDETKEISDLESRLMHLGFLDGEIIQVAKKVALFKGPLLVEVRGRMVALSVEEANLVTVEVIK